MARSVDFVGKISGIVHEDDRYHPEAYLFLMASLNRAMHALRLPRHLSGSELLQSVQEEALSRFGPMASTVFRFWGIQNSLDFGHIVFNMVRAGILTKTERDSLADFVDDSFFENLFDANSGYQLADEDSNLLNTEKTHGG